MKDFELHPRLRADCHVLGSLAGCELLLNRNAALPWFILVPHTAATELHDLEPELRAMLDRAGDGLARWIKDRLACDKVNVAAIGNLVPQLHLHVVGRRIGDACWPQPVWGHLRAGPAYSAPELAALQSDLTAAFGLVAA
jgi:diadenosine tetraphosphate (Ap4A) HIT family hydrolase